MSGMLQTTPWNLASSGVPSPSFGGFSAGAASPWTSPLPYLLQQLQTVPQQLQYVQQAEQVQQQQLQQVLQVLQILPQQIQQLQQVIQFLPQHVAQLVQQTIAQSSFGIPSPGIAGFGAASPFGGLSGGQPLQSPVLGSPFALGQSGYVM